MKPQNRFARIDFLILISVIGMTLAFAAPTIVAAHRQRAARRAAEEIRSIFAGCRSRALARGTSSGVRFTHVSGRWAYSLYDDGNHDGVRDEDIVTHADRLMAPPIQLATEGRTVSIGLPPLLIIDPDGDALPPTRPPVQFSGTTVASFTPQGSSTWGSVYLTDGDDETWVVRLCGATGQAALLRYEPATRSWKEEW